MEKWRIKHCLFFEDLPLFIIALVGFVITLVAPEIKWIGSGWGILLGYKAVQVYFKLVEYLDAK